jgi:hypothetical protein
MIYREKMLTLLESLDTKLRLLEGVSNGAIILPQKDVNTLVTQIKNISSTLQNLVNGER